MKIRLLIPLLAALATAAPAVAADRIAAVTVHGGNATVHGGTAAGLPERVVIRGADRAVLSPDARLLAYTRPEPGATEIRLRVLGGRDRLVARVRPFDIALSFSTDGKQLAYSSASGIAVAPVAGGKGRAVRLPHAWRGSRFSALLFAPDGRRLVVSRTAGDGRAGTLRNRLELVALGSGDTQTLLRSPNAYDQQLLPRSFDPQGRYVAVDGTGAVQLSQLNGDEPVVVTQRRPNAADSAPLISPDGRRIAFARGAFRGVTDVYVIGMDGSGLRRLTTTPIPPRGTPKVGAQPLAWSPDATKLLVFRHDRFEAVDVETRESTVLRRTGVRYAISSARWHGAAPEPARTGTIVFERRDESGAADLWTVRADGTDLKRLTRDRQSYDPAWSPDGTMIAFARGGPLQQQLHTMNADGSSPLLLTPWTTGWVANPTWFRGGPTGLAIAYTLYARAGTDADIWSTWSNGRSTSPLAQTPEREENGSFGADGTFAFEVSRGVRIRGGDLVVRGAGPGAQPQWSPDGRRLVVVRELGLRGGMIGVVDPSGAGFRPLAWGSTPSWSPDGSSIVYATDDGLFAIRADGVGQPRRLTRNSRLERDLSPSWTA